MTSFDEIYDIFLAQINDPVFLLTDLNSDELKLRYLLNSVPKFFLCKQDLSNRNMTTKTFNIVLTDLEQFILGKQMHVEYLSPQISSLDNLKQSMGNNKDFNMTSQAAHLKQLSDLRKDVLAEVKGLIRDYTYN